MTRTISYDGDEFKCIDCVPEWSVYHDIYVAKHSHADVHGRLYQAINTNWHGEGIIKHLYAYPQNRGYLRTNLPARPADKQRCVLIHRLVYLTWCEQLPQDYQDLDINHIDEDKYNNNFSNLELINHAANCNYGHRNKRQLETMIKNGNTSRVVVFDTKSGQEYHFDTIRECARTLNLHRRSIYRCLAVQQRQHHGFLFCREDGSVTK
jgi:hypothetical protein